MRTIIRLQQSPTPTRDRKAEVRQENTRYAFEDEHDDEDERENDEDDDEVCTLGPHVELHENCIGFHVVSCEGVKAKTLNLHL